MRRDSRCRGMPIIRPCRSTGKLHTINRNIDLAGAGLRDCMCHLARACEAPLPAAFKGVEPEAKRAARKVHLRYWARNVTTAHSAG